jgi:hypothetical protein
VVRYASLEPATGPTVPKRKGELVVRPPRSPASHLATIVAVAGLIAAIAATAGPAAASGGAVRGTTVHTRNGLAHYLPVRGSLARPNHVASNLLYHGGPVMKKSHTYAIFWQPPHLQNGAATFFSPQYFTLNQRYFGDVGGNGLYNNNKQYYQIAGGLTQHIKNVSTFAHVWVDTASMPASGCNDSATPGNCLSDSQIQAEVTHAIAVNGWRATPTNMFFVFTPKGEGSCFNNSSTCAFTFYCAYHGAFGNTIYANMPYGNTFPGNCTTLSQFPNEADSDVEISIVSHEHMEAVTDPHLNAWYDAGGSEIGDLCAYNYGSRTLDGGLANEQWNGNFYVVQQEWDNKKSACVQFGP